MNCRGVLDVLSEYLEGEAGEAVCRELEEHLAGCRKCRMHIDAMRRVITLYKKWRDDPIPEEVSQRLQEVFAAECTARLQTPPDAPRAGGSGPGRGRV
jgi:RNA polymerase sigma-70 factor (ECF subfamily)